MKRTGVFYADRLWPLVYGGMSILLALLAWGLHDGYYGWWYSPFCAIGAVEALWYWLTPIAILGDGGISISRGLLRRRRIISFENIATIDRKRHALIIRLGDGQQQELSTLYANRIDSQLLYEALMNKAPSL